MSRFARFATLALVTLTAGAAAASPINGAVQTITRGPARYSCTIDPVAPPSGQDFQVTKYTLKLVSGSPPANKIIKVALGIQPTGQALTTACTSGLQNGNLTVSMVVLAPPVMDPKYIWLCNAVQTSDTCPAPSNNIPR